MVVVAAALAGTGCGGDSADSGDSSSDRDQSATTTATSTQPERPVRVEGAKVAAALNVVVAECIRRRSAGAAARDISPRFAHAVNTLVVQYQIAPRRRFAPKPGAPRTTMEQLLGRVRNTLGRPIPDGCAARTGRRQKAAIRQLDEALKSGS